MKVANQRNSYERGRRAVKVKPRNGGALVATIALILNVLALQDIHAAPYDHQDMRDSPASNATVSVSMDSMSYGFALRVDVNGRDLGLVGQKSESTRLFAQDDPICSDMPKDIARKHCVLLRGKNQVRISYERKSDAGMSVEFQAPDPKAPAKPRTLLKFDTPRDKKGVLTGELQL